MKTGRRDKGDRVMAGLAIFLLCVLPGRAPAQGGVEGDRAAPGAVSNNQGDAPSAIFVPVILTTAGRNDSFFTSELTLTNRGSEPAVLNYTYTPHRGGMSYTATDRLGPLQQVIQSDAIAYLRGLDVPIPQTGSQVGTLRVDVTGSSEVAAVVRTTTAVPEGRAGLAYPGIPGPEGFQDEAVYLCGLRQNRKDRSNVALQNMGTEGEITLRTTVFSGEAADRGARRLDDRTLKPGGFYQYNEVLKQLGSPAQGYVKVERVEGEAPFYAYGVINDQANSDGSFVFPVGEDSLAGTMGQTLPVVIEVGPFTSELTVTNFSEEAKAVSLSVADDAIKTADGTATFMVPLAAGQQRIIPNVIDTARRQFGLNLPRGLAVPLFARAAGTDMSGIVIGARTGSPADPEDVSRGQYSVFYTAVPQGEGFTTSAWVDGLQQNEENRSNLALVNTGEVDDGDIVFTLEIYDGETARLVNTVSNADTTVAARRWHQINGILRKYGKGAAQGFVRITKRSGHNPFLAYGVVNDGGVPGQRSDDGAYLPATETIAGPGTRRMTDREVLEALYHATGGPDWKNSTNWLSALPLAEWHGVSTDGGGRVTRLALSSNRLIGNIPPELAGLTNLKVLYLHANELSGAIPAELGALPQLQQLFLGSNKLSGTIPPELGGLTRLRLLLLGGNELSGTIPAELGTLPQLQQLALYSNRLSGTIPPELGGLTNLQDLFLGSNQLSGAIPPQLGGLINLRRLYLQSNRLTGTIPPELSALTNLQRLNLGYNDLSGAIPAELALLPQLQSLSLHNNQLSGAIPAELGGLTQLDWLNLDSNQLSGAIPPELGGLTELRLLVLEQNRLTGTIPPELSGLTNLESLSVSSNRDLTGALPKNLQRLSRLRYLSIARTDVCVPTDAAFEAWLDTLDEFYSSGLVCDGTRRISFSSESYEVREGDSVTVSVRLIDRTGDTGWSAEIALTAMPGGATAADYSGVPESVTITAPAIEAAFVFTAVADDAFDDGETIVLGFQQPLPSGIIDGDPNTATVTIIDPGTEGATDREVLEALYHATGGPEWKNSTNWLSADPTSEWFGVETDGGSRVTSLDLTQNRLIGRIPPALGRLGRLQVLDLHGNQLSGEIPPELGELFDLQVLDLSHNNLSGVIPTELAGLTQLQRLSLSFNKLSGGIPPELGGLTHLQALFLDRNGLSGAIPVALAGLTHLQALDLSHNNLSGVIPTELAGLTQLQRLSLSFNKLSGGILPELGGLTHLQSLFLDRNEISGAIPVALAGLTRLQRLDLQGNKLSGGIPPELGGLTHLQSLALGGNELSGTIPPELGGLTHLQRLSLGSNELSGAIPAELGALTQLQVLSLWTNQLSGAIPVELAGLTRLQSLDLHGNQLTGPIPAELGALTQLHGLSLGSNELSGTIPTELGRLSQLRWLTLQFNPHLSGAIPPGLQQLPLWSLNLMATSVCVPEDAELQERLAKIEWFTSSGLTCGRPPAAMPSIDVAVFHTPAARRVAGGTAQMEAMIDLMIAETNQAYLDSGVNQRLVLVAREEVKYEEETGAFVALARFSNPSDGYMDEVHAIRDRTGADLLHLIADVTNPRGAARLAGEYAITCAKCDSSVFAHELGHNMGLSHDRYVDGGRGRLSYSYGYVNQRAFARDAPESTRWRTIMAYADQCGEAGFGCDWILRFSNPNQTWLGDPLGVTGDERTRAVDGPADAVRTLNLTRHSVAAFRPRASANQLTMSSTLSQARPLAGTGQAAVAALGGSLFRSIAPNERGTPSHRAGGVLDRATLRRREVSVDFRTLARVADGERTALRLNLFDDLVLMGIIERRTSTYSGGYALSGRLAGVPEGTVTLVVNGRVVAGTVRFPGATYSIRSSGAGRHVVLQADPSQLPQGCEVVTQTPDLER